MIDKDLILLHVSIYQDLLYLHFFLFISHNKGIENVYSNQVGVKAIHVRIGHEEEIYKVENTVIDKDLILSAF